MTTWKRLPTTVHKRKLVEPSSFDIDVHIATLEITFSSISMSVFTG